LLKFEWYDFAELYHKYKCAQTTNMVEGLHSVRRKFADKRLNYKLTYTCRANIGLLCAFLDNWMPLVLEQLEIPISDYVKEYLQAFINEILLIC
jgi:hypothetical protein